MQKKAEHRQRVVKGAVYVRITHTMLIVAMVL